MPNPLSSIRAITAPLRRRLNGLVEAARRPPRIQPQVLTPEDASLYRQCAAISPQAARELCSCLCTAEQVSSPEFRAWCARIKYDWGWFRKIWEWGFICQALSERGLLAPGKRGLAFAVGQEPLPALFASFGCEIMATDLDSSDTRAQTWWGYLQADDISAALNEARICDPDQFRRLVSFRPVDMTQIPDDLDGFDFAWSTCSFEHLGSIELGKHFIWEQMKCLKPGGIAVHTTEFNLSSNNETVATGPIVIFRRRDIEEIARGLIAEGHEVAPLDLSLGKHRYNRRVDKPPHTGRIHLRLAIDRFASTSIGLIIRKGGGETASVGVRARPAA